MASARTNGLLHTLSYENDMFREPKTKQASTVLNVLFTLIDQYLHWAAFRTTTTATLMIIPMLSRQYDGVLMDHETLKNMATNQADVRVVEDCNVGIRQRRKLTAPHLKLRSAPHEPGQRMYGLCVPEFPRIACFRWRESVSTI